VSVSDASRKNKVAVNKVAVNRAAVSKADDKTAPVRTNERREATPAVLVFTKTQKIIR
jgi:hypothetical protein